MRVLGLAHDLCPGCEQLKSRHPNYINLPAPTIKLARIVFLKSGISTRITQGTPTAIHYFKLDLSAYTKVSAQSSTSPSLLISISKRGIYGWVFLQFPSRAQALEVIRGHTIQLPFDGRQNSKRLFIPPFLPLHFPIFSTLPSINCLKVQLQYSWPRPSLLCSQRPSPVLHLSCQVCPRLWSFQFSFI